MFLRVWFGLEARRRLDQIVSIILRAAVALLTLCTVFVCSGFYDRKKLDWMGIQDTTLCAACGPPGGGRQVRRG